MSSVSSLCCTLPASSSEEQIENASTYCALPTALCFSAGTVAAESPSVYEHQQHILLSDMLYSATRGRLHLCVTPDDLPVPLPPVGDTISISPKTLQQIREQVRETGRHCAFPQERWENLTGATSECAMNAFQHGGAEGMPTATVHASPSGDVIQVWVQDHGGGISLSDLPKAILIKGFSRAGSMGYGFFLMLRYVDALYLLTGPQGTTIVLEQRCTPRDR